MVSLMPGNSRHLWLLYAVAAKWHCQASHLHGCGSQAQHGRTCHTSTIAPLWALELMKDFKACSQYVIIQLDVRHWLQRLLRSYHHQVHAT